MAVIDWIIIIPLIVVSFGVFYLWILLPAGILFRKGYPAGPNKYDFLILVPAHDEANGIAGTIESLKKLRPTGNTTIAVIADNCTDNTAEIARGFGVEVYERNDPEQRGKGYALQYGMNRAGMDQYDAVVIVDADTVMAENMLEVMARALNSGVGAVQVSNEFLIDQPTPLAYLQQMANCSENVFYYNARTVLGLPVLLRGTGMAVRTEVLNAHPWDSHSVTEDVDYAVNLIMDGYQIDFCPDTWVRSAATSSYEQSYSQKSRWAGGTFGLIFDKGLKVLLTGLTRFRPKLVDLAWSFFTLSRPTLIFICLIPLILSPFASYGRAGIFAIWAAFLIIFLIAYLIAGVLFVPDRAAALKALLHAPRFGIWLAWVQLNALFGRKDLKWVRTDRDGES